MIPLLLMFVAGAISDGPEAVSLQGKPLYRMELSQERAAAHLEKLAQARAAYEQDPDDVTNHIWLGRRTAYLGRYREAIEIYTQALAVFPAEARLYRHRGHRYISIRKFAQARRDFQRAAALIAGEPDMIEPDGLPNATGIPTSSLHTNIWYHYGLVCYLQADYEQARICYEHCLAASTNNDMKVATLDWLYMTLRRLDRDQEATALLQPITAEMRLLENHAYHRRLLMYKGLLKPQDLLAVAEDADAALNFATQGYGVANFHNAEGREREGRDILKKIIAGPYWSAFGHIAAEADLTRPPHQ